MSTAIERFPRLHMVYSALIPFTDTPTQRAMSPMPGALDLDDVGALVGEQRDRVRPGERDRAVDHPDAVQGPVPFGHRAAR